MSQTVRKKSTEDIAAIREVQCAAEAAMDAVISYLQSAEDPTSEAAHTIIDSVLEDHNCESPDGHIVSSGMQSAEPHEVGTGHINRGVPVIIDIYPRSKVTGYYADMSRTVCVGTPSPELKSMYDAVSDAQELAVSMARPGVASVAIQDAVEQLFAEQGYVTSGTGKEFRFAEGFVHSVGHGVGTNIHEAPKIGRESEDVLEEGDVITIEPGLYYKRLGGIRLEDMFLVTADGAENLTHFPKQFSI